MCGICGKVVVDAPAAVSTELLQEMCGTLSHRGPDAEGIYHRNVASFDSKVVSIGLGFRRLSIIDLNTGNQPIRNERGTVWVVFNGEIYNFQELAEELRARGHQFYTKTDTEVIVHLYEEVGEEFPVRLRGMFGLAVWDEEKQRLILARDRIGIKPLYYSSTPETILFGSELKPILRAGVSRQIDAQALHDYLSYGYIPAPRTIFRDIKKLLPGEMLIWTPGEVRLRTYWSVCPPAASENDGKHEEQWAEELVQKLKESVRLHLVADVPLGVFLSGGIDSSTVVALMREVSNSEIRTFSIGFEEKSYSELERARLIARRFETTHEEMIVRPDPMEILPKLVQYFDEPFADSSAIPTYYVSRLARQGVKAVLGGDGGDELFAGYQTYRADQLAHLYRRLPSVLRDGVIPWVTEHLPVSHTKVSFDYKAKRFVRSASLTPAQAHFGWKNNFSEAEKHLLYCSRWRAILDRTGTQDSFAAMKLYVDNAGDADTLARLMYADAKLYLPDDILTKVDRMSMANSLEARVPLLDHHVVEFALTIPTGLKIRGATLKYIVRKAMERRLPRRILWGKKKGFNVPMASWLNGPLKGAADDLLAPSHLDRQGFFDPQQVRTLLEAHRQREKDYSHQLWGLMVFSLWADTYLC